ncbi:MAG: T9SS type A sorting domain-containing protein [Bacteroidales bacterium]|nr:T9SS type A sorting domain-containing protein [Bacteroidales bacterium]
MMAFDWLDKSEYPFRHNYFSMNGLNLHYINEVETIVFVHVTPLWSFVSKARANKKSSISITQRVVQLALFCLLVTQTWILSGQEPFIHEPSPAPFDQNELKDIDVDADGRMVAVGWWREFQIGGSPGFPLVMIKDQADDPWTVIEAPDFGWTWHDLEAVKFIPGSNGDFVAVGDYYINPSMAHPYGMVLRYFKEIDFWQLHSFNDPGAQFHFVRDFTFYPDDPNRIMIVGTRGISDPGGNCFQFTTLAVDYNIDAHTYTVLPTTTKGLLRSIVPIPNGNFFSVGSAAGDCDYLPWPLIMEVGEGVETVLPNPPPKTPGFWYDLTGTTLLADGKLFMVGHEAPFGGSNFSTLAYRYDPVIHLYESFKPIDQDTVTFPNYTNQLWRVEQAPDGRIFSVGRTSYMYDNLHLRRALIQSFDGENWHLHPIPEHFSQGYDNYVWDLTIHPSGQVYTVGRFREPGIYTPSTLVLRTDEISGSEALDGKPTELQLEMAGPNPFYDNTAFRIFSEKSTHVTVEVMDVLGKQVRLLSDQKMNEGWTTLDWDGQDKQGHQVSSGVYFIRFSTVSAAAAIKVLKSY